MHELLRIELLYNNYTHDCVFFMTDMYSLRLVAVRILIWYINAIVQNILCFNFCLTDNIDI